MNVYNKTISESWPERLNFIKDDLEADFQVL